MKSKKKVILIVALSVALLWGITGVVFRISAVRSLRNNAGMSGEYGYGAVAVKDFEPLEIVFASATGERGAGTDVYNLLLEEAQKVGGQGIINIRIDRQRKLFGDDTFTGSALAIKYTDSAGVPAEEKSLDGGLTMGRGFGRRRF
jgi:hypothetical protein